MLTRLSRQATASGGEGCQHTESEYQIKTCIQGGSVDLPGSFVGELRGGFLWDGLGGAMSIDMVDEDDSALALAACRLL